MRYKTILPTIILGITLTTPQFISAQSFEYLSDINWDSFDNINSGPWLDAAFRDGHHKPVLGETNSPTLFKPISFSGVEYEKGISWFPGWATAANQAARFSEVTWDLQSQYSRLQMLVRCDDYDDSYGTDPNYWQKIEYEWVIANVSSGSYLRGAKDARPWKVSDPCDPGGAFVASELNDPPDPPAQICDTNNVPIGDLYPPVDRPTEVRLRVGAAASLRIYGDGVLLHHTPEFYGDGDGVLVDVDVSNVDILKIELDIGGTELDTHQYRQNFAHAPQLVYSTFFDQVALADAKLLLAGVTNNPPQAKNDSFMVNEDSTNQLLNVFADNGNGVDEDLEGDVFTITQVSTPNQGGVVSINPTQDGILYTPSPNFFGDEVFTYTVSDTLLSGVGVVTVTVLNLPDPPQANDDTFFVDQNSMTNVLEVFLDNGHGLDTGSDSPSISIVAVGTPNESGFVSINGTSDGILYTPLPGFTGVETFTYSITDGAAEDTALVTIVTTPEASGTVIGESGRLIIQQSDPATWFTVPLNHNYVDPVVIMQPVSHNGDEPVHMRIGSISSNQFTYKMEEWEYLDLTHFQEEVSYLVMESGIHTLNDGTIIEVGKGNADGNWTEFTFAHTFTNTPAVLANVLTTNEASAVVVHMDAVSITNVSIRLREQEVDDTSTTTSTHAQESVGYIAIEQGGGIVDGFIYEAGLTPNTVTHDEFNIDFQQPFSSAPAFLARCNTQNGTDPHHLRYTTLTSTNVALFVEEEASADAEVTHIGEVVGFLAIEPMGLISVQSTNNTTMVVFDREVLATSDDAEEDVSSGAIKDLDQTILELGEESGAQLVGLRFTDIVLPKAAQIELVTIQFTAANTDTNSISLVIHGDSNPNAAKFTLSDDNISQRALTTTSVNWSPNEWITDDDGVDQRTPDLSAMVQEIVDQPGWFSGNSLVFIISGTGLRSAKSWDNDPAQSPQIHIEYSIGNDPDDMDGDALPDVWEIAHFGGTQGTMMNAEDDYDGDGVFNWAEFIAGTNPDDNLSFCSLSIEEVAADAEVSFNANAAEGTGYQGYTRYFTLERRVDLGNTSETWTTVSGWENIVGANQDLELLIATSTIHPRNLYRLNITLLEN